jgi:tetratricopeptide (TPR) repeat protein
MLVEMKRSSWIGLALSGCLLIAAQLHAQSPAAQNPPANPNQQPQQPSKPADANSFPEDTSNVPVMPSKDTPALPPGTYDGEGAAASRIPLPSQDLDPVRSPDDMASEPESASSSESSSSQGMDKILPATDDDRPQGKKRKLEVPGPEHKETSAEDIEVGKYEMDNKNWKAALSRFESAMVLAPDEPEVYWGLAESERHLGNLAEARSYYQKLVDYDPDSKHGKEARKALKEPEIANAKAAAPALPAK